MSDVSRLPLATLCVCGHEYGYHNPLGKGLPCAVERCPCRGFVAARDAATPQAPPFVRTFDGMGRRELETVAARAAQERDELAETLTRAQTRCTELLNELRAYRASGICLRGWWCFYCGGFNGENRSPRTTCRGCDKDKCVGTPPQLRFGA